METISPDDQQSELRGSGHSGTRDCQAPEEIAYWHKFADKNSDAGSEQQKKWLEFLNTEPTDQIEDIELLKVMELMDDDESEMRANEERMELSKDCVEAIEVARNIGPHMWCCDRKRTRDQPWGQLLWRDKEGTTILEQL